MATAAAATAATIDALPLRLRCANAAAADTLPLLSLVPSHCCHRMPPLRHCCCHCNAAAATAAGAAAALLLLLMLLLVLLLVLPLLPFCASAFLRCSRVSMLRGLQRLCLPNLK
jgi:hypothetical protein